MRDVLRSQTFLTPMNEKISMGIGSNQQLGKFMLEGICRHLSTKKCLWQYYVGI